MDYKKKYNDALERARDLMTNQNPPAFDKHLIEMVFPELQESKDERMKKAIMHILYENYTDAAIIEGVEIAEIVAWLEKQGENKKVSIWKHWKNGIAGHVDGKQIYLIKTGNTYSLSSCLGFECDYIELSELDNLMLEKQGENKSDFSDIRTWKYIVDMVLTEKDGIGNYLDNPDTERIAKKLQENYGNIEKQGKKNSADNIKPKFHEGEWITNGYYTWKIVDVKNLDYILQSQDDNIVDDTISYVDEHFHLWSIQDANDGDVLDCEGCEYLLFKSFSNTDGRIKLYCWYNVQTNSFHGMGTDSKLRQEANIHPATKEQRDLLFQKMKEAGYEWDSEKKELKKIEPKKVSVNKVIEWINSDKVIEWLKDTIKETKEYFGEHGIYYDTHLTLPYNSIEDLIDDFKEDFGL